MEKEFLLGLALSEEVAQAVLEENGKELEALQTQLRRERFDHRLQMAVSAAGGRNLKAISALLDTDALEDADDDGIARAVEQVKKECGYLFGAPAAPVYAAGTGTVQVQTPKNPSLAQALREKFGM